MRPSYRAAGRDNAHRLDVHLGAIALSIAASPSPASRHLWRPDCIVKSVEVTAEYLGQAAFQVAARNHRVICDQPLDNGGADKGMTPPEFLLASLASCAAYYATRYLKTRGLNAEHLTVRVTAEKAQSPARIASLNVEVNAPGLDDRHQAGLLRAVKACLIHNTLLGQPSIEVALKTTSSPEPEFAVR